MIGHPNSYFMIVDRERETETERKRERLEESKKVFKLEQCFIETIMIVR